LNFGSGPRDRQAAVDVESAQQYAPIPDPASQVVWGKALAQQARSTADCIAGVDTNSQTLIDRSTTELCAASEFIRQTTAAIGLIPHIGS